MTFEKTRNDIIDGALELAAVKAADESATDDDVKVAAKALNKLVKSLQATGAHLWTRKSATLFLVAGQEKYVIGGAANATEDYTATTLSADAAISASTLSLTSTTGALEGDFIGIKLDDGTLFWTTITNPSVTSINDQLPSAATSGNTVYYYTTNLGKALRIPDARRSLSGQSIEMVQMGRIDYLNLPNKATQGTPTQFYYDPNISTGDLFIWPTATETDTIIDFTYYKPLDIYDTSDDEAEFPDEWIEAIEYQLAVRLCPRFVQPVPPDVAVLAITLLESALTWDQGDASIKFAYKSV